MSERSASDWAREMSELQKSRPRPLHKRYGPHPTAEQVTRHREEERAWQTRYRYASKMQKRQLVIDNEAYRRRQESRDSTKPRRRASMSFKTQAEIERAISDYISRGNRAEERRDRAPFESAEYWKQHDIAVKWFTKAESLMPGGSHWRSKARAESRRDPSPRRRASGGLATPLKPSPALAKIVGARPLPWTEVTKKLWSYIKRRRLQDPKDKRVIRTDAALKRVFGGRSRVSMFEMAKLIGKQLR